MSMHPHWWATNILFCPEASSNPQSLVRLCTWQPAVDDCVLWNLHLFTWQLVTGFCPFPAASALWDQLIFCLANSSSIHLCPGSLKPQSGRASFHALSNFANGQWP